MLEMSNLCEAVFLPYNEQFLLHNNEQNLRKSIVS